MKNTFPQFIGLGDPKANLIVYIDKRPPLNEYAELNFIRAVRANEIKQIAELTGNHWRKIFNCYAKLIYELEPQGYLTWQILRDNYLLTENSEQLLSFSAADLTNSQPIKIICGKTYFQQLKLPILVEWLDNYFAINREHKLIVSPYFDYRQLSNQRIAQLVKIINSLVSNKTAGSEE